MRQRLSLLALCVAALAAGQARAAEVRLLFPGLKDGQVVWAVQGSAKGWSRRGEPTAHGATQAAAGQAEVVLDLPPGQYGVMAYLDRNANGKLDTLPVGLPTEPYGFSNNARGRFGPPAWDKARFSVSGAGVRQVIRLR